MTPNPPGFARERRTLRALVGVYCRGLHGGRDALCPGCADLLAYAEARLERCPHGESKPNCSRCPVHCYKPAMRERIRDVMTYAGPRIVTRHPLLAVRHLVRGVVRRPRKGKAARP